MEEEIKQEKKVQKIDIEELKREEENPLPKRKWILFF